MFLVRSLGLWLPAQHQLSWLFCVKVASPKVSALTSWVILHSTEKQGGRGGRRRDLGGGLVGNKDTEAQTWLASSVKFCLSALG